MTFDIEFGSILIHYLNYVHVCSRSIFYDFGGGVFGGWYANFAENGIKFCGQDPSFSILVQALILP